jgi:hypothetical protein
VHSIFFVMAAWEVEICDVQSNLESLLAALKTYVRLAGILTKRAPLLAGSTACGAGFKQKSRSSAVLPSVTTIPVMSNLPSSLWDML